jgi:DNA-binding LacI/PurR family transcriptional regulator
MRWGLSRWNCCGSYPNATTIAVLVDRNYQGSATDLKDVERAAHSLRQNLIILAASDERDLETASATLAQQHADALIAPPRGLLPQ